MRIRRLVLKNWKNFRGVDVPLRDRAFIIGANASGKSNLLDSVLFLRDVAVQGLRDAVEVRGGFSKIRSLHARRDPTIALEIHIGEEDDVDLWVYRLEIGQDNQGLPIVKSEVVRAESDTVLERPLPQDREDRIQLSQTYLEQVTQNQGFRPVADFLQSVLYLHLVPQIIRAGGRRSTRSHDPFGGDFLERVASTPTKSRESRLRRISQVLQVAVPQLDNLTFFRDPIDGSPHIEATFRHWRPGAGRQQETEFSDGTLRLIGLLWAIQDGTGPVVLEEPELSLNSAIIRQIPQLFHRMARVRAVRQRQILLTTHSFDLLTDPGIDPSEVLVLVPDREGTQVKVASSIQRIQDLVEGGLSVADAALPYAEPESVFQLSLL